MTNQFGRTALLSNNPRLEINYKGKSLSFDLTADVHILGREPNLPLPQGLKIPEDWSVVSRCQATIKKQNDSYYIYDGDGEKPSTNKLFVNNTVITPKKGFRLENGSEIKIANNPQNWAILTYTEPRINQPVTPLKKRSIYLKNQNKPIVLGRSANADLELDAPMISRRHATIERDSQGHYLLRDHSTNGLFVNREKVTNSVVLSAGDIIQIGPYTFVLYGDELVLADSGDNIRIDVQHLVRTIKDKNKQPIRLLNDISLVIEPGEFVAVVGGSGAGKSTLLKALLGIESTNEGTVYLNGENLRTNFNIYRNLIGYVPQQDTVHTGLRVKEVLYYAAKLRLPNDTNVEEVVQKTLQQVELSERQNTLVKNLSGGQLKRVSIGVELLADPKLFFLDEPTSGLDPGLDKKIMQLLRKLANEGRTVILVTHATSNITICDFLVFLGLGGNLCYFGPPNKAADFFQINSEEFADVYIKLETKEAVIKEAEKYYESDYQKEYINNRLSEEKQENNSSPKPVNRSFFQQITILIQRYIKLIQRDTIYLVLSLLTAPIGIALMTLAILNKDFLIPTFDPKVDLEYASLARRVLFVFTCAAIWIGLASSLQEIVKESAIYLRERLVNLSLTAYLGSKIITLGGLAVIQSILISLVIILCFSSPTPELTINYQPLLIPVPWFLGVFVTTFLTILTSVSLGLLVSASTKNSTQANSALPLLLLPQIIFAGVLFDMKGVGEYISWLMLSRWSVGAYGILGKVNLLVPVITSEDNDISSSIKQLPMFDNTLQNLLLSWGLLLAHTIVYLVIAMWLQKRKDIVK
ncbi:MAG: ATP-binding cassette domain-containing protein [Desmonostoc vinosum HA7617-LM4]|jgi:ABC-type multidrug transport system ATPase subunit|nr:ATP-binding cassette domain-containing protein [Desmonostoc vinosum HA7617-LM4]